MAEGRPDRGDPRRGGRRRRDVRPAPGRRARGTAPGSRRPAGRGRRPLTRSARRLRALGLLGSVVITVSATVDGVTRSSADTIAAVGGNGPTTTTLPPPATVAPLPPSPRGAPVLTRVDTTDPVVFLTIDDGHTRTPEVAAALRELGAPASLFLNDGPVTHGADFFRRLDDNLVQAHSRTHPDLRTLPEDRQRDEICGNAQLIEEVFGYRPVLFRPPFGTYDAATRRAADACGMKAVVLWEVAVDRGSVSHRHTPELRPGDIVLLHFRPELPHDLALIAQRVDEAGLRFARLEDYLVPEDVPR